MRCRGRRCEAYDFHGTFDGKAASMKFKTFDFVQRFCRQVAFPTMGTAHHWDVLNQQQVPFLAIGSGNLADTHTLASTNVTKYLILSGLHGKYTVMMTSLPVGLSLTISSTSAPSTVSPLIRYFHSAVSLSFLRPTYLPCENPMFHIIDRQAIVTHFLLCVDRHNVLVCTNLVPHAFQDAVEHSESSPLDLLSCTSFHTAWEIDQSLLCCRL